MFIGTLCQVFIVPSLFVIFQYLQEKIKPMSFEDEENKQVAKELKQFLGGPAETYEVEE